MFYTIFYALLAAFALGFLIFLHELGHYLIARLENVKVEIFSIGIGRPFWIWQHKGVKWQLCMIPFGGYVKLGEMNHHPWKKIRIALAGPIVNIVFTFVVFLIIWLSGGREKPFSEHTSIIGYVEHSSSLNLKGISPGDTITSFGKDSFRGFQDFTYAAILDGKTRLLKGEKVNYFDQNKVAFSYPFDPKLAWTISPASYLIFDAKFGSLESTSPMFNSGIKNLDRIVWIDGSVVFSRRQFVELVNDTRAFLTINRQNQILFAHIPRIQIRDLKLSNDQKGEIEDWRYALDLNTLVQEDYFIPYNIDDDGYVLSAVSYVDETSTKQEKFSSSEALQVGDKIIAVDGMIVQEGKQIFSSFQKRHLQMVVQRGEDFTLTPWKKADAEFLQNVSFRDLQSLVSLIGVSEKVDHIGNLYLLNPIQPKPRSGFSLSNSLQNRLAAAVSGQKESSFEGKYLKQVEQSKNQMMVGIALRDRPVLYNPPPFQMMKASVKEMYKTIYAMITGYLSPKNMAGPVGIVQVIQYGWAQGVKEALFWIGMISLNLGIFNLLPVPVLDGGHICFAFYEIITGKRIKEKTIEKLIVPFFILLLAAMIYLTYQDLLRIFHKFF